ncbi:hypothetical protein [Actinomycetospora chiangmaiensis]|uniref:hypothetical protein n=1 Tax=Actinomycetospora chiangmaiensis TaxID=402650 RepID=UPI0003A01592|nr:hypothetical protein [Actinomycetospora chiangmaiensis]
MVVAGVAAVGLTVGATLLLLHDRAVVAVVLLLAVGWILGGLVTELQAPPCTTCGEKFCRRCAAVRASDS